MRARVSDRRTEVRGLVGEVAHPLSAPHTSVLLDEVIAHLDPSRRSSLSDALSLLGVQVWMTGADPAAFGDIVGRAQVFLVRGGTVEQG